MKNPFLIVGTPYAAAVGAGFASALLFSLVNQATAFAIALAYLSPLPIMIAVLGFGRMAGVVATVVAALAVFGIAIIQHPAEGRGGVVDAAALSGLTFAFSLGLPALWLSFLAALSRPKGSSSWSITTGAGRSFARDYCPLERLLTYGVAISATVAVVATIYVAFRHGGFEASLALAEAAVTPVLESLVADVSLPHGIDTHSVARLIILAAPPAVAASTLLMLMLNLWLAGRVAEVSGRLPRPWPDIPRELGLPRPYALVFAAAVAASFIGGFAGLISTIVAAALGMGFALQGLAVIHDLSRGSKFRTLLLILIYVCLSLLMPWPLLPLVLIGLVDSALSLRDRKQKKISPIP
jgi:Predicted membrane protein (DUF2232)